MDEKDKRIAELEAAIRWYVDHVGCCEGVDFLSGTYMQYLEPGSNGRRYAELIKTFRKD